ncbi:hypothetical protein RB195_021436 [Necator americanus]|uniref:Uncharacterized protein n=1 Tax=Necator americanus TaxID=51031 RepID=A0ABR1EB79_NECAM
MQVCFFLTACKSELLESTNFWKSFSAKSDSQLAKGLTNEAESSSPTRSTSVVSPLKCGAGHCREGAPGLFSSLTPSEDVGASGAFRPVLCGTSL